VRRLAFLLAAGLVLLTGALALYRILWLGYPVFPVAAGQSWQLSISVYMRPTQEENVLLGIKGPLAARKILEKPNPPPVKVKVDIEIELTLYVLPNGIVDRVVPSVKGDADLERIAIQYLKQWRFAPLPKDQAQAEQWGTIPVKFKLQ